jgi:hypothetical protein
VTIGPAALAEEIGKYLAPEQRNELLARRE